MISPDDIAAAHERIRPHIRRTPVLDIAAADLAIDHDRPLSLKLELVQHAGSFKARGAFNTLLAGAVPDAGVAAASGGNHGAAVACAAQALGHRAHIFVPEISSPAKQARIRDFHADLVVGGARYADALTACETFQRDTGAVGIHAYDADRTIAGQGTVAREWQDQAPDLDTILVAVGGGGLIAGVAGWHRGRVKVVAVEPRTSNALDAALRAGRPVDVEVSGLAADSLGARSVGTRPFEIASAFVDHVVLVEDAEIAAAQQLLWRNIRIASEPGGATVLAALVAGGYRPVPGERVGVLICGGNVDLATL